MVCKKKQLSDENKSTSVTDLVIIGAGPAGLTAAVYAARAGIKVKVCEKNVCGGQMSIADKIENYPGFSNISGFELSNLMREQAESLGVEFVFGEVIKTDFIGSEDKIITLADGNEIKSKSVIIANGLKRKKLGVQGEDEYKGKGVSYCATCDGPFFKSKDVAVVGGGDTALKDALYLSNICKSVTLVVRKNYIRGEKKLFEAVKNKKNIKVKYNCEVEQIHGENLVNSVTLKDNLSGQSSKLDLSGIFISIGYEPDCEIYKHQIELDEDGYFKVDESCETNVQGVFVAGDCREKSLRQISTATCDGAVSGHKAAEYILESI